MSSLLNAFSDRYVRAVLSNDATWHGNEERAPAKLKARLETSVPSVQAATSSQLNFCLMGTGMAIFGLACAFYYSWQLTLVFIAASPCEIVGIGILSSIMAKNEKFNQQVRARRPAHSFSEYNESIIAPTFNPCVSLDDRLHCTWPQPHRLNGEQCHHHL